MAGPGCGGTNGWAGIRWNEWLGRDAVERMARRPHAMKDNRLCKNKNESVAFPFDSDQDFAWNYFSNQMIIRNFGPTMLSDNIATHYDPFDIDTLMPLVYKSGGGVDGLGGPVAGTDIMLFEKVTGGADVRIKTNIVDTVVVILTNSRKQLHGGVLSKPDFVYDSTAKTTRFIPYITVGVDNWMKRAPDDTPCRCFCFLLTMVIM